eukprot:gene14727-14853_t
MKYKKLLYLVANDRYFCSHRLSLALAAKKQGYDVHVATPALGHIFANNSWLKAPLKIAMRFLLSLKNVQVIVQNPEDFEEIRSLTQKDNIHLLLGAGVNLDEFHPKAEPHFPPFKIIHVSRLLWSKGVKELVEAGKILKDKGHDVQIQIVGEPDLENPDAISAEILQKWHQEGHIEWLGHRTDIAYLYQQAHIASLIAAQWRIQEFKGFPYLYEGSLEYEAMYMHECEKNPEAILIEYLYALQDNRGHRNNHKPQRLDMSQRQA